VVGVALLALFVWTQHRSSHPTIDVGLFRNRHFSSGAAAIATAFFALQGSTFYLAYYLQAVRDYTPLLAGTALIGVAAAVMTAAPLSAKLSARFGPRAVVAFGMTLVALGLASYGFVTQHTSVLWLEVRLVAFGFGMGLTMSPATNAIMSAVPREKAGAGSAVNNTVRQVAGALGVAILGSVLVVVFRNDLGTNAPHAVAAELDRPAAVVSTLPASQRVSSQISSDTAQSIQNALTFVGKAADALQARGQGHGTKLSAAQVKQERAQAQTVLAKFVGSTKNSFMSAMHITSLFGGLAALIGALVAALFLPGRREFDQMGGGPRGAPGQQARPDSAARPGPRSDAQGVPDHGAAHLDPAPPIAEHARHAAQHAAHDPQHEQAPTGGHQ
jgi:DHA2 family integral membrane protein (MFS transporter)